MTSNGALVGTTQSFFAHRPRSPRRRSRSIPRRSSCSCGSIASAGTRAAPIWPTSIVSAGSRRSARSDASADIQAFADYLDSLPLRPGSRHRILSGLKSFFAFAHELELLPANVARPLRMLAGKDTLNERILTEDEVDRLIEACALPRDRLIAGILYYCGLRVSELVNLTRADLSSRGNAGQLTVMGKGNKTRAVLLPDFLWAELTAWISGGDFIFVVSASQVCRIIRAPPGAGISKPVSPHWLRHCHCSHALERGADLSLIQATVGHENVATTSRYLHARPERSSSSFLRPPAPRVYSGSGGKCGA